MGNLRDFLSSSSGLARARRGLALGWLISALMGLTVLLGVKQVESDECKYRAYDDCGYNGWCASRNEDKPIRCRRTFSDCSFDHFCTSRAEAEQAMPTAVLTLAAGRPAQPRLGASYPNPFNPAVVIPLDLTADAKAVSLTVYDVLGRRMRSVWQGPLGAGRHRFTWDGRDEAGRAGAAGVYIYRVEIDGQVEAKKMTKLP